MSATTLVSRANPTIKKILTAISDEGYRGTLKVQQTPAHWQYLYYNDSGEPRLFIADANGRSAQLVAKPGYGQPANAIGYEPGTVLVKQPLRAYSRGTASPVIIYVPQLDLNEMDVARDAFLSGGKRGKQAMEPLLAAFGEYAGIAGAIIESQSKMLGKATSPDREPLTKRNQRLDREIAEFLQGRR